jgi:hypothetical protein
MSAPMHRRTRTAVTPSIRAAEIANDLDVLGRDTRQNLTGISDQGSGADLRVVFEEPEMPCAPQQDHTVDDEAVYVLMRADERTDLLAPSRDDDACRVCGCVGGCDDGCPAEGGEG